MSDIPESSSSRRPFVPVAGSQRSNQSNRKDNWESLSTEEKVDAENSLALYCRPVELYNIIKARAKEYTPIYLQRCLDYRIKAKRNKRLLMTISLSWKDDNVRSVFPLCICLGRLESNKRSKLEQSYDVGPIFTFQGPSGLDGSGNTIVELNFMLPEVEKLAARVNSGKYFLLIFTSAENPISLSTINASPLPVEVASNLSWNGERCVYGKLPLNKPLCEVWDTSPDFAPQQQTKSSYEINLFECKMKYYLQYCFRRKNRIIQIQNSRNNQFRVGKLKISIDVEEIGARKKSLDQARAIGEEGRTSPSTSLHHRFKERKLSIFCYRYYNNKLQKVEVTEDFTCPICLARCATPKGLKCHLAETHDHFNFEFAEWEDCPFVSVFLKTLNWNKEVIGQGIDPRVQTFLYCAQPLKRRQHGNASRDETQMLENSNGSNAIVLYTGPSISDHGNGTHAMPQVDHDGVSNAVILHPSADCVPSISDDDDGTRSVPQVEHEGVSNVIVLHPDSDFVPSLSTEVDHGTHEVPQVHHKGVSNAIILHPDSDFVPSVSEHDHGSPEVPQVDHEGVSNAIVLHPDPDCVPSMSEHDQGTAELSQTRKKNKGKLPIEHRDPTMVSKLAKRQFYHSHKYQAMALEEAELDEDSEDEINEFAEEVEERRRLAMLEAPQHLKRLMPMWNSFVRKHRVLADGHINWACEAFTKYHCAELAECLPLYWTWKIFMIKLFNHGLLKPAIVTQCSNIIEEYRKLNTNSEI